jgi:hypothetical protein
VNVQSKEYRKLATKYTCVLVGNIMGGSGLRITVTIGKPVNIHTGKPFLLYPNSVVWCAPSICSLTVPQLCYDVCDPAEFENKFAITLEKQKPQPRRSMVKTYEPSEEEKMLRKQLNDWRWKMSVELHGEGFTDSFGCATFMADEVLDRICDAAHYDLITSIDALAKETDWHLAKEHGQPVIDIISATTPLPQVQTDAPVAATSGPKPREQTCTSCGQPGHTSKFPSRTHAGDKLIPAIRAREALSKPRIISCQSSQERSKDTRVSYQHYGSYIRRPDTRRLQSVRPHGRIRSNAPCTIQK